MSNAKERWRRACSREHLGRSLGTALGLYLAWLAFGISLA